MRQFCIKNALSNFVPRLVLKFHKNLALNLCKKEIYIKRVAICQIIVYNIFEIKRCSIKRCNCLKCINDQLKSKPNIIY